MGLYIQTYIHNSARKLAFTLAEVLIVLGIIGIVAEITIPTVIKETQDKALRSAAKKVYSTLGQATTIILLNNGTVGTNGDQDMANNYASGMKILKQAELQNVFTQSYKYYRSSTTYTYASYSETKTRAIITADGMFIVFKGDSPTCAYTAAADYGRAGATLSNICGGIEVDTNGLKSPNMRGKDYLSFWLVKQDGIYRVLPMGISGDGTSCVVGSTTWSNSDGCTYYLLYDKDLP